MHKIEIYQRIAAVRESAHAEKLLDELIDRFGDPPDQVINLLEVSKKRNVARKLERKAIFERKDWIEFVFGDKPNVNVENILELKKFFDRIIIMPGPPEIIKLNIIRWRGPFLARISQVLTTLTEGRK